MSAPALDDDAVLERATTATGLSDFGENDEFRIGLRVALAALEESELPEARRDGMVGMWVSYLERRLRLVQHRKDVPEIVEQVIDGPVAVIGLPRTGTTALVDLLAQDPGARCVQQWETNNLFPPADRATWAQDPRIKAMDDSLAATADLNPVTKLGLHTFGATLPDECNSFLGLDFWSPNLFAGQSLPKYAEWLRHARPNQPYLAHRWVLQHLQFHGPAGRWTLKSPFHIFGLRPLLAQYPGAMLVQTHRDPVEVLASNAGLIATIRGAGPGDPERLRIGEEQVALWGTGMQRCLADRLDPVIDARVLDMSHHDVVKDPLGTQRRVYEHFGLDFTTDAEAAAAAWLEHPAQHQSSVRFTLDEFGLTEVDVELGFGPYRSRFADYF
jgi:hypothetical protein